MKPFARRTPKIETETGPDFRAIKARFLEQNRQRLLRTCADLKLPEKEFLDLLPLLFHVNHPILPGYVDKDTPAGVPEYTPQSSSLTVAKRLFKSFSYKKRAYRRFHIVSLFMMGSTGTIAYSNKSDFDIWVVYDSALEAENVERLAQKAHNIEQWARDKGVEASLFLVDPERFAKGENSLISHESSGSAQHYLLLEEFYRTSILLAGRYPLWWLVPPEEENNYEQYAQDIKRKRLVQVREHVDLGGLNKITADEFYGATLWLLYKSIHSPYKSVLKIILMEAYASEYPKIDLLCRRFKSAVYEGVDDVNQLDPYLMMLEKVEEYLKRGADKARLDLARRSFYFKVDEKISVVGKDNWRIDEMQKLIKKWDWHHTQLLKLDRRDQWKLNAVKEERKVLIKEFTNTYRYLSLFARTKSDNTAIRASDLNILGRKLYAAFERKAGKIELVYKGITPNLFETHVSFHEFRNSENQEYWMVFSGIVSEDDVNLHTPLKRGYGLIELLAWCYFNKIIHSRTVLALYCRNSDLSEKELQLIVEQFCKKFPDGILENITIEDMRRPAHVTAVSSFINVGLDPFSERTRRGEHLTSNRTDALKYGGKLENLALSIDQVIVTSWQEVLTFRYLGVDGLMQCIQDYFKWSPPSSGHAPPAINANCFSSYRGTSIARRIDTLFKEIIDIFYNRGYSDGTYFILGVEWEYVVMWMEQDVMFYDTPGDYESLLSYLSKPRAGFAHVLFDVETLNDHVLPLIYRSNIAGTVQCFYEIVGDRVSVYVLDEMGSLSIQQKPFHDVVGLIKQYQEFFTSIRDRMAFFTQGARDLERGFTDILFYRVDKHSDGHRTLKQHSLNKFVKPSRYLRIQVIIDMVDDKDMLSLFCEEKEFSSLEYGTQVYKLVAEYILSMRAEKETYPIYITDIDLSAAIIAANPMQSQTSQYLNWKKLIEDRLLKEIEHVE